MKRMPEQKFNCQATDQGFTCQNSCQNDKKPCACKSGSHHLRSEYLESQEHEGPADKHKHMYRKPQLQPKEEDAFEHEDRQDYDA